MIAVKTTILEFVEKVYGGNKHVPIGILNAIDAGTLSGNFGFSTVTLLQTNGLSFKKEIIDIPGGLPSLLNGTMTLIDRAIVKKRVQNACHNIGVFDAKEKTKYTYDYKNGKAFAVMTPEINSKSGVWEGPFLLEDYKDYEGPLTSASKYMKPFTGSAMAMLGDKYTPGDTVHLNVDSLMGEGVLAHVVKDVVGVQTIKEGDVVTVAPDIEVAVKAAKLSKVGKIPKAAGKVDLKDATFLGQKTHGTSQLAIYRVLALGEKINIAGRLHENGLRLSLRAEKIGGALSPLHNLVLEHQLAEAGFQWKDGYYAVHMLLDGVKPERVVAATLSSVDGNWKEATFLRKEILNALGN